MKMRALDYVKETRAYLDYIEEHINNIEKAYMEVSEKCKDLENISKNFSWITLHYEVELHDVSKFSITEFVPYREKFYPVKNEVNDESTTYAFKNAWDHHKNNNSHHWETAKTEYDIIHLIIDWTAMGYVFNDNANEYYKKNKDSIKINSKLVDLFEEVLDRLK